MESGAVYLPMDRRQALGRATDLRERTTGAALFADISGFTPLTEALTRDLGVQRGPEELTNYLNQVFGAIIAELNRYGGSTISFAGDAITCWFDGFTHDAALRATAAALAMQQAMQQFAQIETPSGTLVGLAMKVGIAAGSARRFVVGEPSIQRIDILAGHTLERVAEAEHHAERGEVVLDEETAGLIGGMIDIATWRTNGSMRFVVIARLRGPVADRPWPPIPALDEALVREWLLPPIYERLRQGLGDFLAELRPAVALFLRFDGLDYDSDEQASELLDAYVRRVQAVLAGYDSYVVQITIGDKGNMLYATFGAPHAHEDDAVRACAAALELRALESPGIRNVQIGISQGRMRAGAYGSTTRRTYGVIGDEVNIAARLMQRAQAAQILVSERVQRAASEPFVWDTLPPMRLKGKQDLIQVFELLRVNDQQSARAQATRYALPMIGRDREVVTIQQQVDLAVQGQGRIVGITGVAGMGKSRMLAEVLRLAHGRGLRVLSGDCQSYGMNSSYHAWQRIGRALFNIDSNDSIAQITASINDYLAAINPLLVERAPLLDTMLGLSLPDNDLTRHFDARLRKSSLEGLMVELLRAQASQEPLMLIIEDGHWFDPLSRDLFVAFGQAIADLPVLVVLTYRPPDSGQADLSAIQALPGFTEVFLGDFDDWAVEQLIRAKLIQFGSDEIPEIDVPVSFITQITERSQGNPFYVEELINYLHDRGVDPSDEAALAKLEVPDTLQRVLLSRIDQLTESGKTTLKVASVVGRIFQVAVLWGAYPQLGEQERVRHGLAELARAELTQLEAPDPELTYLFRHILTQEVAYESLPFATRATLHEQIASFLEQNAGDQVDALLDLLAFHYDRSRNEAKRREYLLRAGEAAQANYANAVAVDYYERVLPLLDEVGQIGVLLKLGKVRELQGAWEAAQARYDQGLALAMARRDRSMQAAFRTAIGDLLRRQGRYAEANEWLEQANELCINLGDIRGQASILNIQGVIADLQGDYATADARYTASLSLWTQLDEKAEIGKVLGNLGVIARLQGDQVRAQTFAEASLAIRRMVGDRLWIAYSLNSLGNLALDAGNLAAAQTSLEEALSLMRQVGDTWMVGNILNNLANVLRARSDYDQARQLYRESLLIYRDFGDRWALAYLLEDVGALAALEHQPERALRLAGAAAVQREAINAPLSSVEQRNLDTLLAPARTLLGDAAELSFQAGRSLNLSSALALALNDERAR